MSVLSLSALFPWDKNHWSSPVTSILSNNLLFTHIVPGLQDHTTFLHGCWGCELRSSYLYSNHSFPLSYHSSPQCSFWHQLYYNLFLCYSDKFVTIKSQTRVWRDGFMIMSTAVLQRTWVQFPGSTWQFITICVTPEIVEGLTPTSNLSEHIGMHVVHRHISGKTLIGVK